MSATFELHSRSTAALLDSGAGTSAATPEDESPPRAVFEIPTEAPGVLWGGGDRQSPGRLSAAEAGSPERMLGLRTAPRPVGTALVVLLPEGALINGVPAMRMAVLHARDLLSLPDGSEHYVTERVVPHFGFAVDGQMGEKCGVCRTRIEPGAFVISCRCGAVMHWETPETTPDKPTDDRWDCAVQLKTCLVCGQKLTREPYLVWDPQDL